MDLNGATRLGKILTEEEIEELPFMSIEDEIFEAIENNGDIFQAIADNSYCDQVNQNIWYEKDGEPDIYEKCDLLWDLCDNGQVKTVLGKDLAAEEVMDLPYYLVDYFYKKYEEILENELYEGFRSFTNMVETDNVSM